MSASLDAKNIEEKMLDQVADAIGGQGSLVIVSGGSVEDRHDLISQVLAEAEGMGCLVALSDCRHSTGPEPIAESLVALNSRLGGDPKTSAIGLDEVGEPDRSYRRGMTMLEILRSASADDPVIVAVEEIGDSSLSTIDLLCFLAQNIGGISSTIIVSHRSLDLDPLLSSRLDQLGHVALVHEHHLHSRDNKKATGEELVDHKPLHQLEQKMADPGNSVLVQIAEHLRSAQEALASGDTNTSVTRSEMALENSISIEHHGFRLDSYIMMGVALTQAGREKEAFQILDQAVGLAGTLGELRSQYLARIRRSELLLFGVGEPDSACAEAAIAEGLSSQLEDVFRIEPLAMKAIVEAVNGRRERAMAAFCEATALLEKRPVEASILERMQLAMAAAMLLEARHDLNGMNLRYAEAKVLASGTAHPTFWEAVVSLQNGRSLLRLKRPQEAQSHVDSAADRFDRLGNTVQSDRARKAVEESTSGIMLD